ncbi:MAG: SbcC/MukB-like Walker B domain-containing protein [Dermatophilaceae bacterium]
MDFRDTLSEQQRAGVEAALEGAGLLDAWVHPDGRVIDDARRDVTLRASLEVAGSVGPTVAEVLRPDLPDDCAVPAVVVESVLASIGLDDHEAEVDVTRDGRWRSGLAEGRTEKQRAQYIGATARAAERQRRLQRVDEELAEVATVLGVARAAQAQARERLEGLDAWTAVRPRHEQVLRAWVSQSAAEQAAAGVQRELEHASAAGTSARAQAVARWSALVELAATHSLPTTFTGLAARREVLATLASRLDGHELRLAELARRLAEWADSADQARRDDEEAQQRLREATEAEQLATGVAAEHDELRSAVGASVLELEQRLAELRRVIATAAARRAELQSSLDTINESIGTTRTQVQANVVAVNAGEPVLEMARSALAALVEVPGLVASGLGSDVSGLQTSDIGQAETRTAVAILGLEPPRREVDATAVLAASRDLQSGPAATLEPRVAELHGVLTAAGRDDTGEVPLVDLAERLRVSVVADRELLTERERRLFEDHVLGHLGDALRGVRLKAEELVTAMNDLLHGVTTSQGIRVRLRWKLRDDIPSEAKRAVQLLGEPMGALLPDERRDLRESLHRLIEVSRTEAPEESYAEHLARALDYRRWFTFRIQYHRPEARDWTELHRKSALSQGEQKVLCYLPLFAAAAAHFTSVAGAAPHAPRFVLLDDAFPKIDIRTHPLLFGLLVDLDLDFVITSERLWGDHATVPELAIYEALRSPTERGIAQYEHRWDGHRLTAVGS